MQYDKILPETVEKTSSWMQFVISIEIKTDIQTNINPKILVYNMTL